MSNNDTIQDVEVPQFIRDAYENERPIMYKGTKTLIFGLIKKEGKLFVYMAHLGAREYNSEDMKEIK
jgi:hypothetical protein